MPPAFRTVAVTARSDIEDKERVLRQIVQTLERLGAAVYIDPVRCNVPSLAKCRRYERLANVDLIVLLGGDGTTLRTVRELQDFSIPLLAINRGTIGFLTEAETVEAGTTLEDAMTGTLVIEERQMLHCNVRRQGKDVVSGHVLNEVVVSQGAIARLIELTITIGGEPFTTIRADGVMVATPTGSTAYNLAAGGPIVHPRLRALIVTPINPYAFSQKPIVIPTHQSVEVAIPDLPTKFSDVVLSLTLDGQVHHDLHPGDVVRIAEHPERVRFLRRPGDRFYHLLQQKLKWGE